MADMAEYYGAYDYYDAYRKEKLNDVKEYWNSRYKKKKERILKKRIKLE